MVAAAVERVTAPGIAGHVRMPPAWLKPLLTSSSVQMRMLYLYLTEHGWYWP